MEGLHFDVGVNTQPFERGMKNVQHQVQTFDQTMKKLGRTIMGVFGGVSVGYVMKQATRAFGIQEKATMQLSIATRMAGDSTGALMDEIVDLGDHLQRMTGIGNEATEMLAAMGLNMGVASNQIVDTTRAASLMSLVFGLDAQTAMRGFAQTLEGTSGMLGRYLPELRNMTEEQLRSGDAINLVIERLGPYEEAMRNTAEVATRRFWEALGDVSKVMGGVFVPGIQKAADWMENFAANIEKPGDILEAIKHTVVDFWEALGPLGKTLITVIGAFVAVKTAGLAWSLLTSAVVTGSKIMIGVFHTLVSWPVLLVAGVYALRVAWEHNWFSIRDTLESFGIYVEEWKDNAIAAFGDVADSWENLMQAGDIEDALKGVVDLAIDILQIPAKIVFGEEQVDEFGGRLLKLLGSLAFVRIIGGGPVLAIVAAITSLGISEQFKEDIQQAEGLLGVIDAVIKNIYQGAQTIGAGFTEAFGGDTQRYMDETNKHLDSIRENIQAIADAETITQRIDIAFELAEDFYRMPAKLVLSGFVDNFDQSWIDNALNMLTTIGIVRFLGGSWYMAVGLALAADIIFGTDVSENTILNNVLEVLGGAAAGFLLGKGVFGAGAGVAIGMTVGLVITSLKLGKLTGEWMADVGGVEGWFNWLEDMLGDWATDTIEGLSTDDFASHLQAFGSVIGLTLVAAIKQAFLWLFKPLEWLVSSLGGDWEQFKQFGQDIGAKIMEGVRDSMIGGFLRGDFVPREWETGNIWERLLYNLFVFEDTSNEVIDNATNNMDEFGNKIDETTESIIKLEDAIKRIPGLSEALGGSYFQPPATKKAHGGFISGPGTSTSDSIPAWLSDGEFVVNAAATSRWRPLLEMINAQKFQAGGHVTRIDAGGAGGEPLGMFERMFAELKATFQSDLTAVVDWIVDVFSDLTNIDTSGLEDLKKTISELEGLESPELTEFEEQTIEAGERLSRMINVIELTSDGLSALDKEIKIFETILGHFEDQIDEVTKLYIDGKIGLEEYRDQMDNLTHQANWTSNALKDLQSSIKITSELLDGFHDMQQKLASGSELLDFNMEPMALSFLSIEGMLLSFGMSMLDAAMNVEAINMLLNPLTTIVRGFFEIAGPILNILKPLGDALASFGRWMAIGLAYMQPIFKAIALIGATISWAMDQIVLMADNIFVWLSGLPIIGGAFDPLLTEDQRRHLGRGIQERMDETTPDQHSTIGTTFQAGSSQEIHNYYYFEFKGNHILTEDDRSVRHFSDLIYNNLRDRGVVELEVG